MRTLLVMFLALIAGAGLQPVFADDEAPATPPDAEEKAPEAKTEPAHVDTAEAKAAREAFAWMEAINAYSRAQGRAGMELRKAAQGDEARMAGLTKLLRENYGRLKPLRDPASEAFTAAFAKVDRKTFVRPDHADDDGKILERGLTDLARGAMDEDPQRALALWSELLEQFPNARIANTARTYYIPSALMSLPDTADAVKRFGAMIETADENTKPTLVLKLGDLYARDADYEKAAAQYEQVAGMLPEGELERRDPRARVKRDLAMRQMLVGNPAPALGETTWTRHEPTTLEALKGKVVLLDFWATWCGPCRAVMPALEQLHKDHAADGLVIIGVTKEYQKRGYLPAKGDLAAEPYQGTTTEDFMAHLKEFRNRMDITYPFAIAGPKVSSEKYGVRGIPTLVLLDPDGKVGYVSVGSGGKAALKAAIKQRLASLKTDPNAQ